MVRIHNLTFRVTQAESLLITSLSIGVQSEKCQYIYIYIYVYIYIYIYIYIFFGFVLFFVFLFVSMCV